MISHTLRGFVDGGITSVKTLAEESTSRSLCSGRDAERKAGTGERPNLGIDAQARIGGARALRGFLCNVQSELGFSCATQITTKRNYVTSKRPRRLILRLRLRKLRTVLLRLTTETPPGKKNGHRREPIRSRSKFP